MMTVPVHWKKSSRSAAEAECVELAYIGMVRDSKNPDGPTLRGSRQELLAALKGDLLQN